VASRLSITDSSQSGQIFKSGENMVLQCTSNIPWFLCVWKTSRGLSCSCQLQNGVTSSACRGDTRVSTSGSGNTCTLTINGAVSEEDAGDYRCTLADSEDIQTVSKSMQILVGVESLPEWVDMSGSTLQVTENEEIEFGCLAPLGYPVPDISVEGPGNLRRLRLEDDLDGGQIQRMSYVGNLQDDGVVVVCTVIQGNEYTRSIETILKVSPAEATGLAVPVGGIIGIILAILFLLALIPLIAFFLFRRKKPKEDDNQHYPSAPVVAVVTDSRKKQDAVVQTHSLVVSGSGEGKISKHINLKHHEINKEIEPLLGEPNFKVGGELTEQKKIEGGSYYIGKFSDVPSPVPSPTSPSTSSSSSQLSSEEEKQKTPEVPIIVPVPVPIINNRNDSETSSSSSCFSTPSPSSSAVNYVAFHEPGDKPDSPVSPGTKSRYKLNKHKLQDGTLVKTAGRTYGEIVEEHLHRNPSLETSKSSVELEQRNRTEMRHTSAWSKSQINHFTFDHQATANSSSGQNVKKSSEESVEKNLVRPLDDAAFLTKQNIQNSVNIENKNIINKVNNQYHEQFNQHHSENGQYQNYHQQQQHQQITTSEDQNMMTKITNHAYSSHQYQKTEFSVKSNNFENKNENQDHLASSGLNNLNYVESAKNKENLQQNFTKTNKSSHHEAYDNFASGVSVLTNRNAVADLETSTSSSSSEGSSLDSIEVVKEEEKSQKTSTPRESFGKGHGQKIHRNDSDSSGTLSNEEIVRSHLSKFNAANNENHSVNKNIVTANEKWRQYNTITEKYVNNAVKENIVHNVNEDVKPLDKKDTEHILPVKIDEEGYQKALAAKREAEKGVAETRNVRAEEAQFETQIVERKHMSKSEKKTMSRLSQDKLMSHTEMMNEHFKNDSLNAFATDNQAQYNKVEKQVVKTAHERKYLNSNKFENRVGDGTIITNVVDDKLNKINSAAGDKNEIGQVRKKYTITQQEIEFYIRNADGTIRIVNRPLLTGEKEYGTLRKRRNSQPSIGTSDHEEAHAGVPGHINNVGNINCQAGMIKHPDLINVQNKQWKSSGSIFDCEQGCFSEDTVII